MRFVVVFVVFIHLSLCLLTKSHGSLLDFDSKHEECNGISILDLLGRAHCDSAVQFYNGTIQKNAYAIVYNGSAMPDCLHPDVRGKVHPTFSVAPGLALEDTIEYFWGLTANAAFGYSVKKVEIQNFINDGDRSYFKAILVWEDALGNVNNYTLVTTMRFHPIQVRKIIEFEIWAVNGVLFTRQAGFDTRIPALREAFIQLTCTTIMASCVGSNQQYANFSTCMDFMHNDIYFDDGGMLCTNSVVCRQFHSSIAAINAAFALIHCPHTGPSGGGKCVEITNAEAHAPVFLSAPRLMF